MNTFQEKKNSFLVERGIYKSTREDRYIESPFAKYNKNHPCLKNALEFLVDDKELNAATRKLMHDSKSAILSLKNKDFNYAIGIYYEEYIIVFNSGEWIGGFIVTYNEYERELFRSLLAGGEESEKLAFFGLCLNLLTDKQRIRGLQDKEIDGIIYSLFPNEEEVINGYIEYINIKNIGFLNKRTMRSIKEFINSDCVDLVLMNHLLPKDIEARFCMRELEDFELAKIEAFIDDDKDIA